MNQILSVKLPDKDKNMKTPNYNKRQPSDIKSVIKFFVIVLILFGIILIGVGIYTLYMKYIDEIANTKPTIGVNKLDDDSINIKIDHDKTIVQLAYSWNGEEEVELDTDGKKNIEQEITIEQGTNKLRIKAIDINGQEAIFEQEFTLVGNISIDLQKEENNIKVLLDSDENISYLTYRWDDGEETKIDINSKQFEYLIPIIVGEHTLTIKAVDENNKSTIKEQAVKGISEPKIQTEIDDTGRFIITLTDEFGLESIELIANETDILERDLDGEKEIKFGYPLKDGENIVKITVTNIEEVKVVKEFTPVK